MRILDAVKTVLPSGKKEPVEYYDLSTIWSGSENTADKIPLADYPRPQFRRKSWICLNGEWKFAVTDTRERPAAADGTITVPFSPEAARSGAGIHLQPKQYLWYYRNVTLSAPVQDNRLLLHFGAVDERCSVWWNGRLVGSHQGGYLPFSFDITPYLREGANSLWVRVQDDSDTSCHACGKQTLNPGGMFYTAQSGIWQTVWMEWVPGERIEAVRFTPLFDEKKIRIEVSLTSPLRLEIHFPQNGVCTCSCVLPRDFSLNKETGLCTAVREIVLSDFHPWSPEDPWLYPVWLSTQTDLVQSYFAMRKYSVGPDEEGIPRLMLNNRPYFFNAVLDQGYWPETLYTPPCDEAIVYDLNLAKKLGFNTVRKHIKIEPLRWYYHCDQMGLVVWQDMVNGGGRPFLPFACWLPTLLPAVTTRVRDSHYHLFRRAGKGNRERWLEQLDEMIAHLYNCPCIGMWIPFNEGWGQFDAKETALRVKEADPTRPVDHASGWFDQGGGDIRSVHNYFRKLKVPVSLYKKGKESRAYVISEYGGLTCPVPGHLFCSKSYGYRTCKTTEAFEKKFNALMKQIRALEKKGLSGAVYTQLSDIEEEINGLVTYDRKVEKLHKKSG